MGFPGAPSPCWDQTGPCPLALVMTSPGPCPKTGLCRPESPGLRGLHREKALWGLLRVQGRVNSVLVESPSPSPHMAS